jgi:GNAT superfamily N-acetyltransferase
VNRHLPRDLGDSLLLRRASTADIAAVAEFNGEVLEPERPEMRETLARWTRDLMSGNHPTCKASDFTIVEDTAAGRIVSSLCLIPQTWSYGGVKFGVGRPELVGTLPEYRKRGLIRAQFDVIHHWSARRGHLVQAIGGIPCFYRQFGYEMALELGHCHRGEFSRIPALGAKQKEPFRVRPAREADASFLARVDREVARRSLVNCVRDARLWRYELTGRTKGSVSRELIRLLETPSRTPVGYVAFPEILEHSFLACHRYELTPGTNWLAVTPTVLRHLRAEGLAQAEKQGRQLDYLILELGSEHPIYQVAADLLRPANSYAYYLRVPDLPAFLRRIAPVLEQRLAGSLAVGYTGELRLNLYRAGLRLEFRRGKLAAVESCEPGGPVAFPDLTFLQLLFGYRSLEELQHAHADCRAWGNEPRLLVNTLFPKQASAVWPLS